MLASMTASDPELADTTPEAARLQLELYRGMSPGQKLALVLDLIETAESFARAGIRMRHPAADEHEVTLRLAALTFGPELVERVSGRIPA